jgi:toxin ParE1/3/4
MADHRRLTWAPLARQDLRDLWEYFARVGSIEVADNVLREINRASARAGQHPLMGRPRDELAPGLRSVLTHPHIVLYRISADGVEIVRVLHQRRDLPAIFSPVTGR